MVFGNGVKNIQAAAYDGARTVFKNAIQKVWTFSSNQKFY